MSAEGEGQNTSQEPAGASLVPRQFIQQSHRKGYLQGHVERNQRLGRQSTKDSLGAKGIAIHVQSRSGGNVPAGTDAAPRDDNPTDKTRDFWIAFECPCNVG